MKKLTFITLLLMLFLPFALSSCDSDDVEEHKLPLVILPEIAICIDNTTTIEEVIAGYEEYLTLRDQRLGLKGMVYYFDCSINEEDFILSLVEALSQKSGVVSCYPGTVGGSFDI